MPTSDTPSDRDLHATHTSIAFSAELLRIALLILTALGALLLKISDRDFDDVTGLCMEFLPAFIFLVLCAALALVHRLITTQSALTQPRLESTLTPGPHDGNESRQVEVNQRERRHPSRLAKAATWALGLSALTLVLGLILAAHPVVDALATPVSGSESGSTDTVVRTSSSHSPGLVR